MSELPWQKKAMIESQLIGMTVMMNSILKQIDSLVIIKIESSLSPDDLQEISENINSQLDS